MSSNVLYFHNILGREEAEERLVAEGIDKTYLARRSPLNGDCYILSYQSNGKSAPTSLGRPHFKPYPGMTCPESMLQIDCNAII